MKQAEFLNPKDVLANGETVRSIEIFDSLLLRMVTNVRVHYLVWGQSVELLRYSPEAPVLSPAW